MRKLLTCLLLALLLGAPATGQQEISALYTGRLMRDVQLFSEPESGLVVGNIRQRTPVDILELLPNWVLVRADDQQGYIQRRHLDYTRVEAVDPTRTPQYPAILSAYLGWVEQETPVLDAPSPRGQALITLGPGTRLAFIGIENGWAKLVYHRQYAWVDTRMLSELQPVYELAHQADSGTPIAAFTSFYRITTDETNRNRMLNIDVANQRMAPIVVEPEGRFDFNAQVGPYRASSGYLPAIVLVGGESVLGYGGGTCQVSSTLYNTLLQLPGIEVLQRRPHGPGGASYLPLHSDAAVGNSAINLRFQNHYPFPVRVDGTAQDGALTIAIYRAD